MAVTQLELDRFHRFASEKLEAENTELTWDELFILWDSTEHRTAVNAAILQGLADVDTGRYESADAVMNEIRDEFGFPE